MKTALPSDAIRSGYRRPWRCSPRSYRRARRRSSPGRRARLSCAFGQSPGARSVSLAASPLVSPPAQRPCANHPELLGCFSARPIALIEHPEGLRLEFRAVHLYSFHAIACPGNRPEPPYRCSRFPGSPAISTTPPASHRPQPQAKTPRCPCCPAAPTAKPWCSRLPTALSARRSFPC